MRRLLLRSAVVGVLLLFVSASAGWAQGGFQLEALVGAPLRTADLDTGRTIVVVWASWSPKCRDIGQRAAAIAKKWGSDARVVTVNFQEDKATAEAFSQRNSFSVPVFLDPDGAFSKAHSVTTLPGLLIVRDGAVKFNGELPADPDRVISETLQ